VGNNLNVVEDGPFSFVFRPNITFRVLYKVDAASNFQFYVFFLER
jgi:hypothetical protein